MKSTKTLKREALSILNSGTCFWLEQKADAECIPIPHQLQTLTLGHPHFPRSARVHKGWENALSIDLWVTNEFQWADYVANTEATTLRIGGIYLSFCFLCAFNWDSGGS